MATYPLTFPSIGVKSSTFRLRNVTAISTSQFTGQQKVYKFPGQWWEGQVTFKPTTRSEAREIQSFLAELQGQYGTFLYGDPDALALGTQGVGGTILVNGASQTGNSLTVDGMTTSTANILRKGDYFQLGTGTSARYYMVTQNLDSDGSGEGTLYFEPSLRESPADNAQLDITAPVGLFRLAEPSVEWAADQSNIYDITISFIEAL